MNGGYSTIKRKINFKLLKNIKIYDKYILVGDIRYSSSDINELNNDVDIKLIKTLSIILKVNRIINLSLLALFFIHSIFIIVFFVIAKSLFYKYGKIQLKYNIDNYPKYNKKISAWTLLKESKKVWQVIKYVEVANEKYTAGASRKIKRIPIKILDKSPLFLKTNIKILQVKSRKEKLIFLPDIILIIRGTKVGAINYNDVEIKVSTTKFIETRLIKPRDATRVDNTWKYVNKDGTPDKRFKYNPHLYVYLYGHIYLTSINGFNYEIECSNYTLANIFSNKFIEKDELF